MEYQKYGQIYVLRLEIGEEIISELTAPIKTLALGE